MRDGLDFAVGDPVVYGGHGIGCVGSRESGQLNGEACEFVVVECSRGLSVTLPLLRARLALRPIATEDDIHDVQTALRAKDPTSPDQWQKRVKAIRMKVAGGKLVELAEVVRDSDLRSRQLAGRDSPGSLSTNERQLLLRARQLLAEELSLSRGLESDEADSWIDAQLAEVRADDALSVVTI